MEPVIYISYKLKAMLGAALAPSFLPSFFWCGSYCFRMGGQETIGERPSGWSAMCIIS